MNEPDALDILANPTPAERIRLDEVFGTDQPKPLREADLPGSVAPIPETGISA